MNPLSIDLAFINKFVVNIALIVGTTLSFYFIGLRLATNRKRSSVSLISAGFVRNVKWPYQLLVGVALGFISFILSLNKIPLLGYSDAVDMRYVILYFAVMLGSVPIGVITSLTLIGLKAMSYLYILSNISTNEFINNIWLTIFLLFVSILIKQKKTLSWKGHTLFLIAFLSVRTISFQFIFYPFFQSKKVIEFLLYVITFSVIFMLTAYVIDVAISISQSVHVYRTAAIYDSLTDVYNRESFHFFLDFVATPSKEDQEDTFSLTLLDIDNFKKINDQYGHSVGDHVLVYLTTILKENCTIKKDFICRIGGDEFAIIHRREKEEVLQILEKIQKDFSALPFSNGTQPIYVDVSFGVSHYSNLYGTFDSEQAYMETDKVLYQAKKNGKNQIVSQIID